MATVWAYRDGAFQQNPGSGWSHTILYNSPADLETKLSSARLRGAVRRLAIFAHGNHPGHVLMDGPTSSPVSPGSLRGLALYLRRDAMLIFVACIAGAADNGSIFLKSASRELRGRVIVGFSAWGVFDTSFGSTNDPGNVQAAPGQEPVPGARLTAWGPWAKWAYHDTIVRLPADEQNRAPNRRCANPRCPGHAYEGDVRRVPTLHHCSYRDWVTDPVLRHHRP